MVRKRSRAATEEGATPQPRRPAKQPRAAPHVKQAKAPAEALPSPKTDLTRLHRARFVAWSPTAIVALAASGDGTLLAAARESGDIELWETDTWTCTLRIPGRDNASLTSLAWLRDSEPGGDVAWRLFSGGLDGELVEWDLAQRRPLATSDSLGGAVWALAVEPVEGAEAGSSPRVAAACDDGCVRVFAAEPGRPGLAYVRCMPAVAGRVVSVAWHPSGGSLVAGTSQGTLHAWDIAAARELLRITVGDGSGREHCVWAVAVLADGTMASGDAGGGVALWDARLGTRLAGFSRHRADVLALAASPDGGALFAAGVDSQVALFRRVSAGSQRWAFLEARRPHTHDVRAAAVVSPPGAEPLLVTGGHDAVLIVHSVPRFQQEHPVRVGRCPQPPLLAVAAAACPERLVAAHGRGVDVWQLGAASSRAEQAASISGWTHEEGSPVDVLRGPRHLARIGLKGPHHVLAAAASPDGALVAASDAACVRLYQVGAGASAAPEEAVGTEDAYPGGAAITPRRLPAGLPLATALALTVVPGNAESAADVAKGGSGGGACRLLLLAPGPELVVLGVPGDQAEAMILATLRLPDEAGGGGLAAGPGSAASPTAADQVAAAAALLAVSRDGRWAAVASRQIVHLIDLTGLRHHAVLPPLQGGQPITAMAFGPGDVLAVADAGSDLQLFDAESARHADWSRPGGAGVALPARLAAMPGHIAGISFNPHHQARAAVLHTSTALCLVDFAAPAPPPPPARTGAQRRADRKARRPPEGDAGCRVGDNFRVLPLDEPCLHAGYLSPVSALLVEKSWDEVVKAFPPPLLRHRYGS
ncbi:hypothetical protein WJX81_005809 [Elliptochloris bilobata]|uniref:Anaphase-promoting complex subunit 4 WD40 domain-containing protein n=1 Tax=Elliptochloris bilobata TaxID=381761 RepID=A0AAW1QW03_9CHLO